MSNDMSLGYRLLKLNEELLEAIESATPDLNDIRRLLHGGANMNYRHAYQIHTPFLEACSHGNIQLVKMLLEDKQYHRRYGKPDLEYFLKMDPDKDRETYCSALAEASRYNYVNIMRLLLQHGATIDSETDPRMNTPLIDACQSGSCEAVQFLLVDAAKVCVPTTTTTTTTRAAVAHVNYTDPSGFTALHAAASRGHVNIVRLLLQHGADTSIQYDGKTALEYAQERDFLGGVDEDVVNALLHPRKGGNGGTPGTKHEEEKKKKKRNGGTTTAAAAKPNWRGEKRASSRKRYPKRSFLGRIFSPAKAATTKKKSAYVQKATLILEKEKEESMYFDPPFDERSRPLRHLRVETTDGKNIPLVPALIYDSTGHIVTTDHVGVIKGLIASSTRIPAECQKLYLNGQEMDEDMCLFVFRHLKEDSTLIVKFHMIQVRTLQGMIIHLPVDLSKDTVGTIHQAIEDHYEGLRANSELEAIPVQLQRLIYNDQVLLSETRTLQSYGIPLQATLYVLEMDQPNLVDDIMTIQKPRSRIAGPEYRGLTLKQLKEVATQVVLRCPAEGWTSTDPFQPNKRKKKLMPHEVTLYDLVHYFVKPITLPHKCSYAELVTPQIGGQQQAPKWFVSHWWGEPVLDFVACLEGHAHDHGLSDDDAIYWVCAYAINQHKVVQEMGDTTSPENTPFYRAMKLTTGALSIVDRGCQCFTRIWCAFEISIAIQDQIDRLALEPTRYGDIPKVTKEGRGYSYEVYTLSNEKNYYKPVGLVDGTVTVKGDDYESDEEYDRYVKGATWFPLDVTRKALQISLETAEATQPEDRTQILNWIISAGAHGNGVGADHGHSHTGREPPKTHEQYNYINALVRGKFAASMYAKAFESGEDMSPYRQHLAVAPQSALRFIFDSVEHFEYEAKHFIKSLPIALQKLELSFSGINFEKCPDFAKGLGRLTNLVDLDLDCGSRLPSIDVLCAEVKRLTRLRSLSLHLAETQCVNLLPLWTALLSLGELRSLTISCFLATKLTTLEGMDRAISSLRHLQCLSLSFSASNLVSMGNIENCFIQAPFRNNNNSGDKLQYLVLSFENCRNLQSNSCDKLWEMIGKLPHLLELSINVIDANIHSLKGLGKALVRSSSTLQKLWLKLGENEKLTQTYDLPRGLSRLHHVTDVTIAMYAPCNLSEESVLEICRSIPTLKTAKNLQALSLVFRVLGSEFCDVLGHIRTPGDLEQLLTALQ